MKLGKNRFQSEVMSSKSNNLVSPEIVGNVLTNCEFARLTRRNHSNGLVRQCF
jgi:hypothetical protein